MPDLISERKLAANRANALKSTGPRTAEGKLRSSRNAVFHSLSSFAIPLAGVERRLYLDLERQIYNQIAPINALEATLVRRLAAAHFHLRQVERVLQGFYDLTDFPDLPNPKRATERHRCRRLAARLLEGSTAQKLMGLVLRYQGSARREIQACEKQLDALRAAERETKPLEQAMQYAAMHLGRQGLYRKLHEEARRLEPVFSARSRPSKEPSQIYESTTGI